MITKDNFKKVLSFLGFKKEAVGEYYSKKYSTCNIHVDFDNEALIYPEDKGLVVNDLNVCVACLIKVIDQTT